MDAIKTKLSDMKLLLENLDEPTLPNPYKIISEHIETIRHNIILKINKHNIIITNNNYLQPHPLAILYLILFLIYSYYYSISILSQLTFTIIIYKSVNESMRKTRYAQLQYSIYSISKVLGQVIGDFLTIPYHLLCQPSEIPYIYYQNTILNTKIMKELHSFIKYTPTFWQKSALTQFLCIAIDETPLVWFFEKSKYHIKRECIKLNDQGLIALDWWVKPTTINKPQAECKQSEPSHFQYCQYSDKQNYIQFKSRLYYQYNHKLYQQCFSNTQIYPMGQDTPILLVFPTFAGDSVSSPVRHVCKYFVERNWRVIVYVKRGCGSFTKGEFLPLSTLKPFCLHGQDDYDVIINTICSRYSSAPKLLMGLSGGGAYIQSILGNDKYNGIFCGGVKIDSGMDYNIECKDLDRRQPLIANVLGQFFDVAMMKCMKHKQKYGILEEDENYDKIKWDKIYSFNDGLKSMEWSMQHFVSPCYGYDDDIDGYLDWAKPGDLENVKVPFLILATLNDFMRNSEHICNDFCKRNENVIHVVNKRGAHCIRREGLMGNKCWLAKVAFVFGDYIVRQKFDKHKK